MESWFVASIVGLALGARHALEPDHLAAVSTLASEQTSRRGAWRLGALWGLGHAVSILLLAGSLIILRAELPLAVTQSLELVVAMMIFGLGVRALVQAWKQGRQGTPVPHLHANVHHVHPVKGDHIHLRSWTLATRPLLVGVVHGLAGSGALTILIVPQLPTVARLAHLLLFALGSTVGMAALTGAMGSSVQHLARAPRSTAWLLGTTGTLSLIIGAWWGVAAGSELWSG